MICLPKFERTLEKAIQRIALGVLCVLPQCNLWAQEPAAPATPVPVPAQEEKPQSETKPAQGAVVSDPAKPAQEAKPEGDNDLDMFDDFFGKKPKDKPKAKKDDEEDGDLPARPNVAVPVPAIRIAPALRIAPAAMPADLNAPDEAGEVDLDPKVSRLSRCLKLERALLRRACTLTPEQETSLNAWDAKWLNALLDSEQGKKLARNLNVVPMGFPNVPGNQFREVLLKLIEPELKKILSEEQQAAYQAEVDARIAFEKQTQVDATIAILDHHLMLSSDQRSEVEKVVAKMSSLPQEPLNYLRYGQYIPNMSFTPVLKHLNKYQRKIFQGLQQVQFGSSNEEDPEIIED